MAKYVLLLNWTEQGVKNAMDTVSRTREARSFVETMGGKLDTILWTAGEHDLVAVVEAPDDETLAAILLSIVGSGNLRTKTLRAFDENDMSGILGKMP